MAQAYSDSRRASDPHALPDVEVWEANYGECPDCGRTLQGENCTAVGCNDCNDRITKTTERGWFWWTCFPGCLPDGEPMGPFATEAEALADAREGMDTEDEQS